MQVSSGRPIIALKMKICPEDPCKARFSYFLRPYSTKLGLSAMWLSATSKMVG